MIWFSTVGTGKIGYINPENDKVTMIKSEVSLQSPEALIFDDEGSLWIAEHLGSAITKFNPVLETFERIPVPDSEAITIWNDF